MNPTSKGGFHVCLWYIWGFTRLTLNNFWVMMKSYQNSRKIKCQQETHVGMKLYQTLGLGQATNHAIVWKFMQQFIVPYLLLFLSPSLLFFFSSSSSSSSSPLLLSLLRFFGSSQMRPNLVLNKMSFLKPCLAPKNPFFWVKFSLYHFSPLVLFFLQIKLGIF